MLAFYNRNVLHDDKEKAAYPKLLCTPKNIYFIIFWKTSAIFLYEIPLPVLLNKHLVFFKLTLCYNSITEGYLKAHATNIFFLPNFKPKHWYPTKYYSLLAIFFTNSFLCCSVPYDGSLCSCSSYLCTVFVFVFLTTSGWILFINSKTCTTTYSGCTVVLLCFWLKYDCDVHTKSDYLYFQISRLVQLTCLFYSLS